MKTRYLRKGVLLFIPPLALALAMTSWCGAEMMIYEMQFRPASEALPSIQTMLSKEGRAVADPRTNALLIDDNEEAIQRVREFLASYDQPGKQARIRVRFVEAGASDSSGVAADARASGSGWVITTDPRKRTDGVDVRLKDRSLTQQGSSEFFVAVVSGSPAYIMVGQDILYNQRWVDLTRRYARITESVAIQRIETGFEVKPVILKDHADVEITPRISHGGPRSRVIHFTEASTRLVAPIGQWVTIGGSSQQSEEVIRAVLEAGRGERRSVSSISLLVEPGN